MDTELRKLSDKLNIHGVGLTFLAMALHADNPATNLYNAEQISHYFTGKLKKANDLNEHADPEAVKLFGKAFANQLVSNNYPVAKSAYDKMTRTAKKIMKQHNISEADLIHYGVHPRMVNIMKHLSEKNRYILKDHCNLYPVERLNALHWIYAMKKHPNYKSIASRYSSLVDPDGIPDGYDPKEATENTKKYLAHLKKQTVWSPEQIISYCNKHLSKANKDILTVRDHHKGIHYKKFLTNDPMYLSDLHDMGMQKGLLQDLELDFKKKPSNYKEALYWITSNKIPYVRVLNTVKRDLQDGQKDYSFKCDIDGSTDTDWFGGMVERHHVTDMNDINDYFNYVVDKKPIL